MPDYIFESKKYHKKIQKKSKFKPFLIIFVLIFIISIILSLFYKPGYNSIEFHFLVTDEFETYKNASLAAGKIRDLGGAGFCYRDGNYKVMASVYLNEKQASSVLKNIKSKYPKAKILSLDINKKNFDKIQTRTLLTIDTLIKANSDYAKNNIDYTALLLIIENQKRLYKKEYDEFINRHKTNSKLNSIKENFYAILQSLNSLELATESELSSTLQYHLISIVFNLYYTII